MRVERTTTGDGAGATVEYQLRDRERVVYATTDARAMAAELRRRIAEGEAVSWPYMRRDARTFDSASSAKPYGCGPSTLLSRELRDAGLVWSAAAVR